jgi:acetyl esterase
MIVVSMVKAHQDDREPGLGSRIRMRAGAMIVDGFFRGISSAGKLHPRARPERHQVEVIRDIAYQQTDLAEHRLDIYRTTAVPGPYPIVIYAHGGGFRILSKDSHWLMGLIFARRGYLVFNISYRLAPRHPFPSAVEDTCAAYEWVVANAERYGGDLSRVIFAGESAGANLVTGLSIALAYERQEKFARRVYELGVAPRAVMAACGVLQVSDPGRYTRSNPRLSRFIGDRINEVTSAYLRPNHRHPPELLDFADPLLVFERGQVPRRPLPAFFAPVGKSDPVRDDTSRLKVALDNMGVTCEARFYRGHHAFHALILDPEALRCWREWFEFLDRQGLRGPRMDVDT